jgi:phage antirepressor YoqD-like protein
MIKFTRTFNDVLVRMIRKDQVIYYSGYDVATALNIQNKRKAVNEAVIMEAGSFLDLVEWENEKVLFVSAECVIALAWKAEWEIAKSFIKWIVEVIDVAKGLRVDEHESLNNIRDYFATTQIGKKYGMSARKLNEILCDNSIQYKVSDQWVLYSKYQDLDLSKSIKVPKSIGDGFTFHTYWTKRGVNFIENLLDRLGYRQQGEQLKLF